MALLIPLVIFFIMCILLVVFMAKSQPPGPVDTAEAFCDAVIRDDKTTLEALSSIKVVRTDVIKLLKSQTDISLVGKKYNIEILEDMVSNDSTFVLLEISFIDQKVKIDMQLTKTINRWVVSMIRTKNETEIK